MATSIHDLLDTANLHAAKTDPTPAGLADAASAIGHLGRALRLLVNDGLSQDVGGYRERFVSELANACAAAAGDAAFSGAPLSLLCGAAADLVGILRPEWSHAGRWAAALAVTETARQVAAVLSAGEQPTMGPQLAYLRRATVLVERTGAIEPPTARQAWLLDRPLPSPVAAHEATPDTIGDAMVALAHHSRPGTNLSVAEVLAVCIAAETACRHTPVSADSGPALAEAAADAWRQVRVALRPINDGSRQRHDTRPVVVAAAIRLHDSVVTGRADASSSDDLGPLSGLRTATQLLPAIAEQLRQQVQQWPATRQLCAYAADLPSREDRVAQQLAGHRPEGLIHVDIGDLTPVLHALHTAESATAALSIGAPPAGSDASSIATGPLQRLTAANHQRLTDWRTEPRRTATAHVPDPPNQARLHVAGQAASRPR
ncbi:MAG TPA: hypothetical protein VF557_14715 [Jatrophihabitans sp.]|uniref:hypothetical protein n=1 Tax=Jatrophihabitans sp. TaxID=1932789 RepID=UPI002EEC9BB9